MRRFMKKLRKQFRYGEKGFTLIELLVVVAILGVLAAVVVPNVVKFMGTGQIEAANTEAHDVQLAVVAYMADNNLTTFDADVGPATATGPEKFLVNYTGLQAVYTIGQVEGRTGEITSADKITEPEPSKWGDLVYTAGTGWHTPT